MMNFLCDMFFIGIDLERENRQQTEVEKRRVGMTVIKANTRRAAVRRRKN